MGTTQKLIHRAWLKKTEQLESHESAAPGELEHCSLFSSLPPSAAARFVLPAPAAHYTSGDTQVIQRTGKLLSGEHALVWYELLRRCLLQPMPEGPSANVVVHYSEGELLRKLKKANDRKNRQDLRERIDMLCDVVVQVIPKNGLDFHKPLMSRESLSSGDDARHAAGIPVQLANLFARQYSVVNMDERLALKDPLARWLHGHFSPYDVCFSITLPRLRDLSGRGELRDAGKQARVLRPAQRMAQFKEALLAAATDLDEQLGWTCRIGSDEKFHVKKPKTPVVAGSTPAAVTRPVLALVPAKEAAPRPGGQVRVWDDYSDWFNAQSAETLRVLLINRGQPQDVDASTLYELRCRVASLWFTGITLEESKAAVEGV